MTLTLTLTYPHEVGEQRQSEGPVQLDLILHQHVLQRAAAAPLQHEGGARRVQQAAQQRVQVLVPQPVQLDARDRTDTVRNKASNRCRINVDEINVESTSI